MDRVRSKSNAPATNWGLNSKAFLLCNEKSLTIKHEVMPAGDSEVLHLHVHCTQCFFMLKGEARLVLNEDVYSLNENDCITVLPGMTHLIKNESPFVIEFLVISHPEIGNDRVEDF